MEDYLIEVKGLSLNSNKSKLISRLNKVSEEFKDGFLSALREVYPHNAIYCEIIKN